MILASPIGVPSRPENWTFEDYLNRYYETPFTRWLAGKIIDRYKHCDYFTHVRVMGYFASKKYVQYYFEETLRNNTKEEGVAFTDLI